MSATLFQGAGHGLLKAPKASLTSVFCERLHKQIAIEGERFKNYTFRNTSFEGQFFLLFYVLFADTTQLLGSSFPDQGLNPGPGQ